MFTTSLPTPTNVPTMYATPEEALAALEAPVTATPAHMLTVHARAPYTDTVTEVFSTRPAMLAAASEWLHKGHAVTYTM